MTAFSDYLDLRTAVIEQVGNPGIADVFDRLTQLAEARFNRKLRTREQIETTMLTLSGNVATLPADFLEVIGVYGANGYELTGQTLQRTEGMNWRSYYSIGNTEINGNDGEITFQYYATIPTLTTGLNASNWLLAKYPEAYLYGVGYEAATYLKDVEQAQIAMALRDESLQEIEADDNLARYARANVRVKGCTP